MSQFLTNLPSRRASGQVRSLDGMWRAVVDPYDVGNPSILGPGFAADKKPSHPGERIEYDFDQSMEVQVPGDWNTQHPELLYYEGTMFYRTRFSTDAEADGTRTFLHFGAANHTVRVYLDGEVVGDHIGGYGPFSFEVTGRLGAGEHSLVVSVNNRREADRIPAMRTDWWNFGGITQSVELVTVPETFLAEAWITMAPDGAVIGGVRVDGREPAATTVSLPDLGVSAEVGTDGSFALDVEPERWNPGAPVLHAVEFRCGNDVVTDEVGFRTVRVEGTQILVNEAPTFLHGIALHAEGPSGGQRANGAADAEELLGWAADLGANFVRLAHYQHDEAMVREADRRGLLAWCELPVYWGIAFGDDAVLANAKSQADELVIRDRSRASVILWSAANETFPGDDRLSFLRSLVGHIRTLDPTRLATAALFTMPTDDTTQHIEDPLGEYLDVIGINEYLGWYYGSRDTIAETAWTSAFGKPIIFTELGAGAKAGHHGTADEIWTEEFQAAVYEAQIEMIKNQTECAGLSPWILKDFRTPVRVLPGVQDGYNRKGLVSEEGERKLAFAVLQAYYATF